MKKKLLVLTLMLGITVIGMSAAFADDTDTYGRYGGGMLLHENVQSVEELLQIKLEQIDKLVADGKLTAEDGAKYKEIITERMADCTTVGENRDNHERLGIGFGRGSGAGTGLGRGMGYGAGNR